MNNFQIFFWLLCALWGIHSIQKRFNLAQVAVSIFDLVLLYGLMVLFILEK